MKTQTTIMIAAVIAAAGFAWRAYAAGKTSDLTMTAASELKWIPADPKNEKGPQIATVWGDPRKGPAGFIMKVPPGGEAPIHSHTHDYYSGVISGAPSHRHTKEDA